MLQGAIRQPTRIDVHDAAVVQGLAKQGQLRRALVACTTLGSLQNVEKQSLAEVMPVNYQGTCSTALQYRTPQEHHTWTAYHSAQLIQMPGALAMATSIVQWLACMHLNSHSFNLQRFAYWAAWCLLSLLHEHKPPQPPAVGGDGSSTAV